MMGKKRFANDPLLYIHQPMIRTPEAPMQHKYHTPKKAKDIVIEENPQKKSVRTGPIKRSFFQEQAEFEKEKKVEALHAENDSEQEEKEEKTKQGKFNDMTIYEKVAYFSERPSHAPIVRCELKTDERTFRGVITESTDDHVFMRVGRRSSSTKIPFDEIVNVRMLGF